MSGSNQANESWSAHLHGKTSQFNFSYQPANAPTQTTVPASKVSSSNKENTRNKANSVSNHRGSKTILLPPPPSSRLIGGGKRKTRGKSKSKGKGKSATRKKKKQY